MISRGWKSVHFRLSRIASDLEEEDSQSDLVDRAILSLCKILGSLIGFAKF